VLALLVAALPVAAFAWVGVLLAAPVAPVDVAGPVYLFGSFICHQIAERSFHVDGVQLPVCGRCFGIYAGAAVGLAASLVVRPRAGRTAGREGPPYVRLLLVSASIPTLATLVLEWSGLWQPANTVRAIAGAILGMGVALAVMAALHYEQWQRRRPVVLPPSTPI
jgi:uncharacterized membrane protein